MKKLFPILATVILLICTACSGGGEGGLGFGGINTGSGGGIGGIGIGGSGGSGFGGGYGGGGGGGGSGGGGSGGGSGNGDGTFGNPYKLTENKWTNGNITDSTQTIYYSFSVKSGTTYYVWWNDKDGDRTKTLDVRVNAQYSDGSYIFSEEDSGWSTAQSFMAISTSTVKLSVFPYNYGFPTGSTGTFAIAYTTTNSRPK